MPIRVRNYDVDNWLVIVVLSRLQEDFSTSYVGIGIATLIRVPVEFPSTVRSKSFLTSRQYFSLVADIRRRPYRDRSQAAEIYVLAEGEREAESWLKDQQSAQERLGRVAELIEGFETPYGLELPSTVHWVATREPAAKDPERVVEAVRSWSPRKAKMMRESHIRAAYRQLRHHGWIDEASKQPLERQPPHN